MPSDDEIRQQAQTLIQTFLSENGELVTQAFQAATQKHRTVNLCALLKVPLTGQMHIAFVPAAAVQNIVGDQPVSTKGDHAHWLIAFGEGLGDIQVITQIGGFDIIGTA